MVFLFVRIWIGTIFGFYPQAVLYLFFFQFTLLLHSFAKRIKLDVIVLSMWSFGMMKPRTLAIMDKTRREKKYSYRT